MDLPRFLPEKGHGPRWALIAMIGIETLAVVSVYAFERLTLWSRRNGVDRATAPYDPWFRANYPGVVQPPVHGAEAAGLADDEEVIGVVAAGRPRAYRLSALVERQAHIVNDLVNGVPVSVTYCDLSDCVRVYTDPSRSAPLDVSAAGLLNGNEMVVRLDGDHFLQKSGAPLSPGVGRQAVPYALMAAERTSWKAWKDRYRDTEVFVGVPEDSSEISSR